MMILTVSIPGIEVPFRAHFLKNKLEAVMAEEGPFISDQTSEAITDRHRPT